MGLILPRTIRLAVALAPTWLFVAGSELAANRPGTQVAIEPPCLTGQVFGDKGEGLQGAMLKLVAEDTGRELTASANATGRFTFQECSPGWFDLIASHPSHVSVAYGATEPGELGTPLVLGGGISRHEVSIRLRSFGIVAGAVRLSDGQPVGGVTVSVLASAIGPTGSQYYSAIATGQTNRDGAFRISEVPPGRYRLRGAPFPVPISSTKEVEGYSITFFPSALKAEDGAWIEVRSGEETYNGDILLRKQPFVRLKGTALVQNGSLLPDGIATLEPFEPPIKVVSTTVVRQGYFSLPEVQPGQYLLRVASAATPGGTRLQAVRPVTLMGDVATVSQDVVLRPGSAVAGSLEVLGSSPAPSPSTFRIVLQPRDASLRANQFAASVKSDGSFLIPSVDIGEYRVQLLSAAFRWKLNSATIDGQDFTDSFLEIAGGKEVRIKLVASDRLGELTGSLMNSQGAPGVEFTIVLFPADRDLWSAVSRRSFATRPADTGQFRIRGIPAGNYRISVVAQAQKNQWLLPDFLDRLVADSTPTTVTEASSAGPVQLIVK